MDVVQSMHFGEGTAKRFVYVGSAAAHKNVGVLLRAGPELASLHEEASIAITVPTGQGGAVRGIEYVGYQDRRGIVRLLADAYALIMPSLSETVGLPLLEAMTIGVPIVAADRPFAHAVCGDAALYFDPSSPTALVSVCSWLAANPARRDALSVLSRQRGEVLEANRGDDSIAAWLANSKEHGSGCARGGAT